MHAKAQHPKQEQRVVADPWTSGPATLAEDSRFGANNNKPGLKIWGEIHDPEHAKNFTEFTNANEQYIKNTMNHGAYMDHNRAKFPPGMKFSNYAQNPIPSLSKSFIDKTQFSQPGHVAGQVQAVGVLRKSDDANARMSVQEAVAAAPKVMAAADKLRAEVALHELETNQPLAR